MRQILTLTHRKLGYRATTALLALLAGGPALADGTAKPAASAQVEEVVVTAQKRVELGQHAPLAVTTLKSSTLSNAGVTELTKLWAAVPGILIDVSLGEDVIFLRGVGPQIAFPNYGAPVPMLLDGLNIQREATGAGLFDIAQVEVLRGPQGTLYGKNAIGGVVNVTTHKPVQGYAASAEFELGNYGENRESGMVNVPLTDTLAVRASVQHMQHDGYLTSGSGYENSTAGRVEARYKPNDQLEALLTGSFSHEAGDDQNWVPRTCGVALPHTSTPPYGQVTQPTACNNGEPHKYGLLNSNNPWYDPQSDAGTYAHENGWSLGTDISYKLDAGPTLAFLGQVAHASLSNVSNVADNIVANRQHEDDNSEEVRLSDDEGKGQGELKWLVGLYRDENVADFFTNVNPATVQSPYYPTIPDATPFTFFPGPPFFPNAHIEVSEPTIEQTTYASYGQATYSVLDNLRITGGLRYSWDRERGQAADTLVDAPFPPFSPKDYVSRNYQTRNLSWKTGVDMDLTPSSLVYANIQTGYLAGGFDLSTSPDHTHYKPETMLDFSVGSKNRFLDNTLQINSEAFYYDYKDYQLSYTDPNTGQQQIENANKVTIYGAELTTIYKLTPYDSFNATINYLHAQIDKFVTPFTTTEDLANNAVLIPAGTSLKGYELIEAPKWSTNIGYQHDFPLTSGGLVTFRVDSHFETSHQGEFELPPTLKSPSFTKTSLNLTYFSPDNRYHINAYVQNLENAVSFGTGAPLAASYIYPPRTYGIKLGFDF